MTEKTKRIPRNYWTIAVRIVKLVILLSAIPLYIVAINMAYAYNRPAFFLGLVLFLIVYVMIAFFGFVEEIPPLEMLTRIARKIWNLTEANDD